MPAPLPTNLLERQPANPAAYYLKGAEFGLEQQTAQARLAEFAQRTQLEQQQLGMEQQKLGMMEEENKMKHLEAQQSLAIEKSYRDMQLTAQKRQLDMAGQRLQEQTKLAAMQSAAMMEYDQGMQAIESNPALDDVQKQNARAALVMRVGPKLPMGRMTAVSEALKQMAPTPSFLQGVPVMGPEGKPIAGMVGVPGASGRLVPRDIPGFQREGSVGQANILYAREYQKELDIANAAWDRWSFDEDEPPKDPVMLKRWTKLKARREDLKRKIHKLVPEPGTAALPEGSGWQDVGGFKIRVQPKDEDEEER